MSPHDEYARRLGLWEARIARVDRLERRLGTVRLALAGLAVAVAWASLHAGWLSGLWLLVPAGAFAAAVARHAAARRERASGERAAAFYRRGIERLQGDWSGKGTAGERFADPHHVYAADLDLFGRGGLFELVCAARTRMGEQTLASWLMRPATLPEIRERHAAIEDLRGRVDLREDVIVLPGAPSSGADPNALCAWAESANGLNPAWIGWAAVALPALAAACAVLWAVGATPLPLVGVLIAEGAVIHRLRVPVGEVLEGAERTFAELRTVARLLARIEREPFRAPVLKALVRGLESSGESAVRSLERLATLAELAGSRENLIVQLLAVPSLYAVQVALAAERWRDAHGLRVRAWIEAVGRFEALGSLAQHAYERPADCIPELIESPRPIFEAEGLGHPFIPAPQCVRNAVSFAEPTRVLLVSGSNMSGKSTLLRAVGVNTVLAMAGAPVCARAMRLTALQVGASIRLQDSLAEGRSRFYAEVRRLRQLHDLAHGPLALFFLLDEILQGTHSTDRRIGAEAIVRTFVRRNAIGLLSTHDLALTQIEAVKTGVVRNVHFRDEIRDGHMTFDFRLRDGVVARSNGLELMRSIGFDV